MPGVLSALRPKALLAEEATLPPCSLALCPPSLSYLSEERTSGCSPGKGGRMKAH